MQTVTQLKVEMFEQYFKEHDLKELFGIKTEEQWSSLESYDEVESAVDNLEWDTENIMHDVWYVRGYTFAIKQLHDHFRNVEVAWDTTFTGEKIADMLKRLLK